MHMHASHRVRFVHPVQTVPSGGLLTAREVQQILQVDRSTVYRMAEDGRLPAIRVGRSWRFASTDIAALLGRADSATQPAPMNGTPAPPRIPRLVSFRALCECVIAVPAELLGISLVVTDMTGAPVTGVANPCAWFEQRRDDPTALTSCVTEWAALANDADLSAAFRTNHAGFQCARAFLRADHRLIGMVIGGGIVPPGVPASERPDLHHITDDQRSRALLTLPRIAATISQHAPVGALTEEYS